MDYVVRWGSSDEFRLIARMETKDHPVQAELCLKGPKAKSNFKQLKQKQEAIEQELGPPLEWRPLPKRVESQIVARLENESDWGQQHKWLADCLNKMHEVFDPNWPPPTVPAPSPSEWHTGKESKAHESLKRKIAGDPAMVGVKTAENGVEEHLLWSGDRVDIYFAKAAVAVEVKTADAGFSEIHRGIFQCIKYKAVLQAQQKCDCESPTADCLLALGGALPEELQDIAKLLNVRVMPC